jgi:hypothetical protein
MRTKTTLTFGVVVVGLSILLAGATFGIVPSTAGLAGTSQYPLSFLPGSPSVCHFQAACINATFVNSVSRPMTVIVYAVFGNAVSGQNITTADGKSFGAATCTITGESSEHCYVITYLNATSTTSSYRITIFAAEPNGTRVSPSAVVMASF